MGYTGGRKEENALPNCRKWKNAQIAHPPPSSLLERVLVSIKNTLLDEDLGIRAALQALLEAVGAHVEVELLLVALEGGGRRGLGQDVALDEVVALGAVGEALLEVVCCALALELEGPGLEGAIAGVSLVMWRRGGGGCRQGKAGVLRDKRVKLRTAQWLCQSGCVCS
jgi:hypothetical protein